MDVSNVCKRSFLPMGGGDRDKLCGDDNGRASNPICIPRKLVDLMALPSYNPNFVGRTHELVLIRAALQRAQQHCKPARIALYGLPGIGKTQVALAFAHQFGYEYHQVCWIDASSPELVASAFSAFAECVEGPVRTVEQAKTTVFAWMRRYRNWLMVFDGIEEQGILDAFLPPFSHGHVLWTSRRLSHVCEARGIKIERMALSDAVFLLFSKMKGASCSIVELAALKVFLEELTSEKLFDAVITLCQALGCYPLALDQAGAYMHAVGCSASEYLACFNSDPVAWLKARGPALDASPASVWEKLVEVVRKGEERDPEAMALLRPCAFLVEAPIPVEVLCALASEQSNVYWGETLKRALHVLQEHALISLDGETMMLTINPVLAYVIIGLMSEQERFLLCQSCVRAAHRALSEEKCDPFRRQQLHAHLQQCLDLIERFELIDMTALDLRSILSCPLST